MTALHKWVHLVRICHKLSKKESHPLPGNGYLTLTVEAASQRILSPPYPCLSPGIDRGLKDGGVAVENVNIGLEMKT